MIFTLPTRSSRGVVAVLVGAGLLAGACRPGEPSADQEPAPTGPAAQGVAVDYAELAPGDSVMSFRVGAVDIQPNPIDGFGWMGRIVFAGTATLSGSYRPHFDYPEVRELCFYPDPPSAERLPRFPNDERISWFCFTNQEDAQNALGGLPAAGQATIVIDRFDYLYEHTDTFNTARLESVLSHAPAADER
jgi:hypothetical protein